jgi:hypothetical protein
VAAVIRRKRSTFIAILLMMAAAAPAQTPTAKDGAAERLSGNLDMVLLLDKSLSMAPFFDQVKAYAAGEVLGPILIPGDRLIIELVYGKTKRLYSGTIASEADKAAAIRSVRTAAADGPFTDLGTALDVAAKDVTELGQPERPKYVLLLTDERQEAPAGSPYQAPDYKLKHPSLEYVKRVDLGRFRSIAIGLQVGSKIAETAPQVMRFLSEPPPERGAAAAQPGDQGAGGAAGGGQAAAGSAAKAGAQARQGPSRALVVGAAALAVALLAVLVVLLVSGRKRKEEGERRGAK